MTLREELKQAIEREMAIADVHGSSSHSGRSESSFIEQLLDEIELILKKRAGFAQGGIVPPIGKVNVSADPLGADRKVRELPGHDPLGGAARGVGRCTCAAGPGTNPSCPVHP